ncbi:hypothetical protein CATRI_00705 [Corynebacterium atrinae]|uniref:PrsW family intramembrane metalloprotease n=1 Tax=Corynebacterium atrinae TaxID=1336740 RepID=UPI0025B59395|nr:PrsW family intramembrane metalloprotease [Corynebacterium atrinae]WJY62263.1 hypothetical protein CATRI_00705 [Corynebacterium atrinae]
MSMLFRVTLIISVVLGVPIMLYFVASNFFASLVGGSLGAVFLVLYCLLVGLLLRLSPMWPEKAGAGWKWVMSCIVWGGGVCFVFVFLAGLPVISLVNKAGWDLLEASFGGAYPEEIAKFLGVGVILFAFRGLNRPWHGFMTGALVGLGFEAVENAMYGAFGAALDANSDTTGALYMWGLRLVAGPGLHIVFTALAGWGLGLALFTANKSTAWRWATAGGWLFLAFALHFAWNLMWPTNVLLIVNYVVVAAVMYPIFIWVWLKAHRLCKADTSYSFTQRPLASVEALSRG